jgi:hypothetical protein
LAETLPTSGGRSVAIVSLQINATEFVLFLFYEHAQFKWQAGAEGKRLQGLAHDFMLDTGRSLMSASNFIALLPLEICAVELNGRKFLRTFL